VFVKLQLYSQQWNTKNINNNCFHNHMQTNFINIYQFLAVNKTHLQFSTRQSVIVLYAVGKCTWQLSFIQLYYQVSTMYSTLKVARVSYDIVNLTVILLNLTVLLLLLLLPENNFNVCPFVNNIFKLFCITWVIVNAQNTSAILPNFQEMQVKQKWSLEISVKS